MAFNYSSAKSILAEALHKANNAVSFDHRQNFNEAIRSYGDSCALLGQVMRVGLDDGDQRRLEAIRTSYIRRIYELQGYAAPSMRGLRGSRSLHTHLNNHGVKEHVGVSFASE